MTAPVLPVNQKGEGQRACFLPIAAQGFDSSSMTHEENVDHRREAGGHGPGKKHMKDQDGIGEFLGSELM